MKYRRSVQLAAAAAITVFLATVSCGYHVAGKADLVPKNIHTIAIPAFSTFTTRYRLVDELPQEIGREFIARTRFHIVQNPNDADAVLSGTIVAAQAYPAIFDPTSGKATTIAVTVSLAVNLLERTTGKVIYSRSNYNFRQNYQAATNPHQFFDESGPAFDRLSRDVAHDLVTGIIENF